jgi:uncharacterized damage-inducible protein DinB
MRQWLIVSTAATLPLVATTALAQVADLKQSFAFLRTGIEKLTNADAERKMPWFDGENTFRGILYFFTRHTGEHTGQLIAYARVNGITPPWSEGR